MIRTLQIAFGLDWIRLIDPPRWVTAAHPDHVELGRDFYAAMFEWSFRGQRHLYAVPVKTRRRDIRIGGLFVRTVAEEDTALMLEDLTRAVRSTVRV